MVQEQVYTSSSSVADPEARKTTYKVMEMGAYGQSNATKRTSTGVTKTKNNTVQKDVWGPVFQNKQHFVDMHIC